MFVTTLNKLHATLNVSLSSKLAGDDLVQQQQAYAQ